MIGYKHFTCLKCDCIRSVAVSFRTWIAYAKLITTLAALRWVRYINITNPANLIYKIIILVRLVLNTHNRVRKIVEINLIYVFILFLFSENDFGFLNVLYLIIFDDLRKISNFKNFRYYMLKSSGQTKEF